MAQLYGIPEKLSEPMLAPAEVELPFMAQDDQPLVTDDMDGMTGDGRRCGGGMG